MEEFNIGTEPKVLSRDLERVSQLLSINCYLAILASVFSCVLITTALLLPGAIPVDARIFILIMGLAVVIGMIVLIIARKSPALLVIFSSVTFWAAGVMLGVAVILIVHVVVTMPKA